MEAAESIRGPLEEGRGGVEDFFQVGLPREWMNREGRGLNGSMIGYRDGKADLALSDTGQIFAVNLEQLSDLDQAYAALNLGRIKEFASGIAQLDEVAAVTNRLWPSKLVHRSGNEYALGAVCAMI